MDIFAMPEGNFTLLAAVENKAVLEEIISFVKEHASDLVMNDAMDGYTEYSSNSFLEFSAYDFLKVTKSILGGKDWIRIYSHDEYDQGEFWYIDQSSEWVTTICEGDSPTDIVATYKRWHKNLRADVHYGSYSEDELKRMEVEHGSYDPEGNLLAEGSSDTIDQIKVRNANKKWNWYIPDHESLARKIASEHLLSPDNHKIEFRRTFKIKDCLGYVWSWESSGFEIFHIFMYFGLYIHQQRGFVNKFNLDVDEVINHVYLENTNLCLSYPEGCLISDFQDQYMHSCLEAIDDGLSNNNLKAFKGKVVSGDGLFLTRKKKQYYLSVDRLSKSADGEVWLIQDSELDSKLQKHASNIYSNLGRGVCCSPKMRLADEETISELIAVKFYKLDRQYNKVPLDEWKHELTTVTDINH